MENAYYRISLDVHDITSQAQLTARRWETGRTLVATLTENGEPYQIAENCVAEFVARKPDGSILKNQCTIEDNQIIYNLTMRSTSVVGLSECELRLMDGAGKLLTSPQFSLMIYPTVYDYGDAAEQETVSANTQKSANPAYAEVYMWSDGNPDGEDRVGYFVRGDTDRSGAMITKANADSEVRGVTMAAPGFATNASGDKFDENSNLMSNFAFVGMLGFVPVIDNGLCEANELCRPGSDGTAVPAGDGAGYLVVERIDDTHVLIMLKTGGWGGVGGSSGGGGGSSGGGGGYGGVEWLTPEDIYAMLDGTYEPDGGESVPDLYLLPEAEGVAF